MDVSSSASDGLDTTPSNLTRNYNNTNTATEDSALVESLKNALTGMTLQDDKVADVASPFTGQSEKKLVSAMKGTREKLGIPAKKMTVTWAPDVYDPPPTVRPHNQPRSRSNKSSKHKHKSKSSSSSSSGKKNHKHRSRSSERMIYGNGGYSRFALELMDFSVTDSMCGGGFLGMSLDNVLVPVAEAK